MSVNAIIDFFTLGLRRRPSTIRGSEDAFIDMMKSHHQDLWRDSFSDGAGCIVCCPVSESLGDETPLRDHFMSHILYPERQPGEYKTLLGQRVQILGNEMICDSSFIEPRKVRVLSVSQVSDQYGKVVSVYRVTRPLVGGILAPEESDEVSIHVMHKYVAILRSFPEAESAFHVLDKYIEEVNFVGLQSEDGFSSITPSLAASLKNQWGKTRDRLIRAGTLSAGLGSDPDISKQIIGQIVESYLMNAVTATVYPWTIRKYAIETNSIHSTIASLQFCTQTDLGIRPELQCSQMEAVKVLCTLGSAVTPVDKLLVLKKAVSKLHESVDRNVRSKFPHADVEMATDDIVLFIIWIIVQVQHYYKKLLVDLKFATDYHFVSSSKSQLGFTLCHFQVAIAWLTELSSKPSTTTTAPPPLTGIVSTPEINFDGVSLSLFPGEDSPSAPDASSHKTNGVMSPGKICLDAERGNDAFAAAFISSSVSFDVITTPIDNNFVNDDSVWSPQDDLSSTPISTHRHSVLTSPAPSSVLTSPAPSSTSAIISHGSRVHAGKVINIVGRDESHFPYGLTRKVTILSERTNKPGTIYSITGGNGYFAAINVDGNAYTWGSLECGRLGMGVSVEIDTFCPILQPIQVIGFGQDTKIRQVSCGKGHMLAVTEMGEVFAWGDNRCAQLGITPNSRSTQSSLSTSSSSSSSSLSSSSSPPGNSNSRKTGSGIHTHLPTGTSDLSVVNACNPLQVDALRDVFITAVACGAYHSLCLSAEGVVYSWGRAANGRLGQFAHKMSVPEHAVGKPAPVRPIWRMRLSSASASGSMDVQEALRTNDHVRSTNTPSSSPSAYSEVRIVNIAAGYSHSVAITSIGTAYTWGCGTYGRLGHGSHCDEYFPKHVRALGGSNIFLTTAHAGHAHTMFLTQGGQLFGCGLNKAGQVGGTLVSPVRSADKFDKDCFLVPQPVEIYVDSSVNSNDIADTRTLSSSNTSGAISPTSSEVPALKLPTDEISIKTNEVLTNNKPILSTYETGCVHSVSCGDHHTAAVTFDNRLVVWGACRLVDSDGEENLKEDKYDKEASTVARVGPSSTSLRKLGPGKREIFTDYLGGEAKQVACAGAFTLATI